MSAKSFFAREKNKLITSTMLTEQTPAGRMESRKGPRPFPLTFNLDLLCRKTVMPLQGSIADQHTLQSGVSIYWQNRFGLKYGQSGSV